MIMITTNKLIMPGKIRKPKLPTKLLSIVNM